MCVVAVAWLAAPRAAVAGKASHVRLVTPSGPIHVWKPATYDAATAGIVVYVHGYFTRVDRAWRQHRLARQFAVSRVNAVFIACDAPVGPRDDVRWASIAALLETVAASVELPEGRVAVVGHSGAHRTLSAWLGEGRIDTIVLVDAMYGDMPQFRAWLDADPGHRLIDVADQTRPWTDALHAELPETLVFERFPSRRVGKLAGARDARVVYVRSQLDHMSLVTDGIALPMLLRALRMPRAGERATRTRG